MSVVLMNLWSIFLKGGPMMWPLLILSILAITLAFEKWMSLRILRKNIKHEVNAIFSQVKEMKLKEAVLSCDQIAPLLGSVLKTGILKYGANQEIIYKVMEQSLYVEKNELKKRMNLLAAIVNLAPLLGMLATLFGLTVVFQAVHMRSNALNPLALGDMASGIWQALVASSMGLAVGIIAFVAHVFLTEQIDDVLLDMEDHMSALANLLHGLWEGENASR